jgi:hypothetical protein
LREGLVRCCRWERASDERNDTFTQTQHRPVSARVRQGHRRQLVCRQSHCFGAVEETPPDAIAIHELAGAVKEQHAAWQRLDYLPQRLGVSFVERDAIGQRPAIVPAPTVNRHGRR